MEGVNIMNLFESFLDKLYKESQNHPPETQKVFYKFIDSIKFPATVIGTIIRIFCECIENRIEDKIKKIMERNQSTCLKP